MRFPYSAFSRIYLTDLQGIPTRVSSEMFVFLDYEIFQSNIVEKYLWFSCIFEVSELVGPESRVIGFGVMDMSTKSENHKKI